jgi:hypothetical protein
MEIKKSILRLKLGKLYHSGILLEILDQAFYQSKVIFFLYGLSKQSRDFLITNKQSINNIFD